MMTIAYEIVLRQQRRHIEPVQCKPPGDSFHNYRPAFLITTYKYCSIENPPWPFPEVLSAS